MTQQAPSAVAATKELIGVYQAGSRHMVGEGFRSAT